MSSRERSGLLFTTQQITRKPVKQICLSFVFLTTELPLKSSTFNFVLTAANIIFIFKYYRQHIINLCRLLLHSA